MRVMRLTLTFFLLLFVGALPASAQDTNALARDAITNGATTLPVGSITVKENYAPDSTLAATTVMYKYAGYDAAHNNWFWLKRLATGEVEAAGRVEPCQTCHGESRSDFIRTQTLGAMRP